MKHIILSLLIGMLSTTSLWAGEEGITVKTLARSNASWNGATLPAYPDAPPEIRILRIQIPPGATLPLHKHPFINAGVLISGELQVETESGKTLRLGPGDPIVEVVNTWHSGKNSGLEIADIIVFYASTADQPITVLKQDPAK